MTASDPALCHHGTGAEQIAAAFDRGGFSRC
jgi:hypothetical protein